MATIGSISVAFEANLKGLESGIESVVDLFDDVTEAAEALKEQLDTISEKAIKVKASVDTKEIDAAEKKVDGLSKTVESSASGVKVTADTAQAQSSVSRLSAFLGTLNDAASSPRAAVSELADAARGMAEQAEVGGEELSRFADSTQSVASSFSAVNGAASRVASATSGVSSAIAGWTSEYTGLEAAIDRTLVAISRSQGAYAASAAAVSVLGASLGGISTAAAAFAGSAAAAAISIGSLAAGAAGAVASLATYATITGLVRAATANMSQEARDYVDSITTLAASTASVGAGLLASAAAYRTAATAIWSSASASTALTTSMTSLLSAMQSGVARVSPVARVFGTLASAITLIGAASNENTSGSGFAALVARVAASSAASGAAIGAIGALSAGTGLLAGASAGATSAVAGLYAAMPVTAAFAVAAAVATGKFSHALEELSVQAQQVDQMAARFGAPRKEIEQLRLAAVNTGVGFSQLAKGQQAFYTSLSKIKSGQLNVENVREAKLAFDRLGISLDEVKNARPEEVFRTVAEELSKVSDPAKKTQIAFDLFGKQGAAILPALKEFGELAADFERLGGSVAEIDFQRFLVLEGSFDRLKQAGSNLSQTLLVPFVELQKAFNNFAADLKGGMTTALSPLASLVADATKPLAVLIEIAGRLVNIFLRIAGVVATLVSSLSAMAGIADMFSAIQNAVYDALEPVESFITLLQTIASGVASYLRPVQSVFSAIGTAIGVVVGGLAQLLVYVAIGAAAWGIYSAAVAVATGFSLTAAVAFVTMWAAALGPFAPIIAGLALIGVGIYAITSAVSAAAEFFYGLAESAGLVGGEAEQINVATASVEELAAAAETAGASTQAFSSIAKSLVADFAGQSIADAVFGSFEQSSADKIAESLKSAKDELGDLTIQAARFGQAGADAASAAQSEFNDLQKQLASGQIDLPTFDKESKQIRENLERNLEILTDDSPEITLKKNLELYKQLDDAAKAAAKSVRDIGAGAQIGDKFFPRSSEVKAQAKKFEDEYVAALEAIKKKQQSGDFGRELTAKKKQNQEDFDTGKISQEQFAKVKLELDSTSAQEQASIAAEDAQREFDRKKIKLEADISFADSIRKELETAFLSPIEKFQKELKKIQENPELTASEKSQAEASLRKQARESLVGKDAQTQLQERSRDLRQGVESGLISQDRADFEGKKAMDEFAKSLGVVQTPFEEFSTSMDGIAERFGMVGVPLDEVRKRLEGTPEQLALFDRALKESRDKLLASLGIEKSPQQVFEEQMAKIEEAANSTDPNKRISEEQRQQAESVARRARDKALGAGDGLGEQFAERQAKIAEAYGQNDPRRAIAENALAMDKRAAAGLDADPSQVLKAGADKINDVFNVTGMSMEQIQAALSPEEFADYQEAIKKNNEAVKASLGIEKSGADRLAESREKLDKAFSDGIISAEERDKAVKKQRDELLSSLGISKSPAQEFEDAVSKIRENAAELSPDEIAKGLKEAKDRLLESLGVPESPTKAATESLKKLAEAFSKGQISAEELAAGAQAAKDALLQSLGIPLDPVAQLGRRLNDLGEAFSAGLITQEEFTRGQEEARRSMLPGSEQESPVAKFKRDMDAIDRAAQEGLIGGDEASQRRMMVQAQLQEDMKPALDRLAPDRRAVESSDVRSKGGVDTFFRILRGNDNPSLKAQLEIARHTRDLLAVAREPEAAPVIANLIGR